MKLIDSYIAHAILNGVLLMTVILGALYAVIIFASESSNIGKVDYTLYSAFEFTLFSIPRHIYELFPLTVLLGSVMGLGRLTSTGELMVIRTSGVSLFRIIISVIRVALVLIFLGMLIGEVIAPPMTQYAQLRKVQSLSEQMSLNTDYGLWARDSDVYIHIRRVENNGKLTGIKLYKFNKNQKLQSIISAASAEHKKESWELSNVVQTEFLKPGIVQKHMSHLLWSSLLKPELIDMVSIWPEHLSIWKLRDYISYLQKNDLDSSQYELSFWHKVMMPLTIATMVLLAIPFVFVSAREGSVGNRIFLGFLAGLTYYIVSQLIGQASIVYSIPAWVGASIPTLLVLTFSLYNVSRIR